MPWWTRETSRQLLSFAAIPLGWLVPGGSTVGILASWDFYAVAYLILTWLAYRGRSAAEMKATALSSRRSGLLTKLQIVQRPQTIAQSAAMLALVASVWTLPKAQTQDSPTLVLVVCVVAVVTGWFVLQTGFAISYLVLDAEHTGLDFPGTDEPGLIDFAYFAVAVGTTFGTTDVTVTTSRMRRRVLSHAILAFVYNTTIVAVTLTILTSYLSGS